MKNTCVYHLCVSCKKGLMFRSRQDYIRFINNMALLAYKYHIRILAFAVMSNHYHIGIMTDDYEKFFRSLKVSYSNYYLGTRSPTRTHLPGVIFLIAGPCTASGTRL